MKPQDVADFGPNAYDEGARAVQAMTEAMIRRGPIHLTEDLAATKWAFPAFNLVLIALLFGLAERYGITPTRAAGNLGQEISTITPPPG